jgi:hypothetical protein
MLVHFWTNYSSSHAREGQSFLVLGNREQGTGYRLQVTGNRLQVTGYRLQGTGYRLQGTGYRLQVTGNSQQDAKKPRKICFLMLTKNFKYVIIILIRKNYLKKCEVQS